MISPFTAPNTRIVCINTDAVAVDGWLWGDASHLLKAGSVYVLDRIELCFCRGMVVAVVRGVEPETCGFPLFRFELAGLPEVITNCLQGETVRDSEKV